MTSCIYPIYTCRSTVEVWSVKTRFYFWCYLHCILLSEVLGDPSNCITNSNKEKNYWDVFGSFFETSFGTSLEFTLTVLILHSRKRRKKNILETSLEASASRDNFEVTKKMKSSKIAANVQMNWNVAICNVEPHSNFRLETKTLRA